MMVSRIAIAAEPPKQRGGAGKRQPGAPDDGLEELIGPKPMFSIGEFAALLDRSPATVWRLRRLQQLETITVGGVQRISRREALRFLRRGAAA
jgi:hypothetical protein